MWQCILICRIHLFHQFCWQQVFNKLSQVLPNNSLMEESHAAVQQPDDGGSSVGSQVAGQAPLTPQVHDADPNTWCNGHIRKLL